MTWSRCRSERGAVTAELALALPVLVAVTIGLVWLLSVGMAQIQLIDATREAARALARGDSEADALAVGQRIAPGATTLTVSHEGTRVVVSGLARIKGPGGIFARLGSAEVSASAVALMEADP